MPHIHDILQRVQGAAPAGRPTLAHVRVALGALHGEGGAARLRARRDVGFALGVLLAHSRILRRGLLPYVVVSQTVPILAVAPMVVVWLGTKGVGRGSPSP